jgi:hypothetical protein
MPRIEHPRHPAEAAGSVGRKASLCLSAADKSRGGLFLLDAVGQRVSEPGR